MLKQFIETQRDQILKIARKHGAISIKLFGSIARGEEREDSDLDFLVELEQGRSLFDLGGLQMELEQFLKHKVDVVTPQGLRERIRPTVLKEAIVL